MYWKNLLKKQPWIYSPQLDLLFIIAPPFFTLLVIFIFHDYFAAANVTLPAWIILVLLIDVSHVYSTLYRTYFDKETLQSHKLFLTFLPLCCWIVAILSLIHI